MNAFLSFFNLIPQEVIDQLQKLISDGESVTLIMALIDTIPVIVFMIGMAFVIKMAYGRIKPVFFALLCGGVFTSFFGGISKCFWKILCAAGINYTPLTVSFSIYQTVGFCLIAVALISFAVEDKKGFALSKEKSAEKVNISLLPLLLFIPASQIILKAGFMWFIAMALFTVVYLTCLAVVAFRRKMVWQGILFFLSMALMFVMAGLSSKFDDPESSFSKFNWVAQIVNIVVQLCMAIPAYSLSKAFPLRKPYFKEETQG